MADGPWAFPKMAGETGGRLAWCWGDASIAALFLRAADALADTSLRGEAIQVLSKCLLIPAASTRIRDAGICHGAAGIAQICSLFNRATSESTFGDSARFWAKEAVRIARPDPQGDGVVQCFFGSPPKFIGSRGFLMGAAGVGTVLLAMAEETGGLDWWARILGLQDLS